MSKNPVFDGISSVWLLTVKTNQNSHEKSGKWYGVKIMTSLAQFKTSCSWTLTFVVNNLNSDSRNKETLFLLPDFRNVEVSCFFKSLNSRQTQITSLSLIWSELLFMKLSDVKYILGYAFHDGDVFFIFSDWKLTNCVKM